MQSGEQQRSLLVQQARPDEELRARVAGDVDTVGERNRRLVGRQARAGLPVVDDRLVLPVSLSRLHEERRRVLRERLGQPLFLVARHLDDVAPVLVRDLVGEALVDSARVELVLLRSPERVESLLRDEHDAGRRLAEAVGVDLEDVELGERKWTQELLVELDDRGRQVHELLHGALVLEGIRRDPDRHAVAHLFLVGVIPGENHGELDRVLDPRLQDVLVAFLDAPDRLPGREWNERLLDSDDRVERVVLLAELGLREPRPDAELPEVGAPGMDQEIAVDLETQLHRPLRPRGLRELDQQIEVGMIEGELAALPVGDAAQTLVAFGEMLSERRVDGSLEVELENAGRRLLRHDRLDDRQAHVLVVGSLDLEVHVRQHEPRLRRIAPVAAELAREGHGEEGIPERRLARPAALQIGQALVRVQASPALVEQVFGSSGHLDPDASGRRIVEQRRGEERRQAHSALLQEFLPMRLERGAQPGRCGRRESRAPSLPSRSRAWS